MSLPSFRRAAPRLLVLAALAQGCARTTSTAEPGADVSPLTAESAPRPLPPVPEVDGPLAINVVYPRPNQVVTSRDSNFIFGSIGSGKAALTVNGVPARVYPNGAFMAWLANPRATDSAQVMASYELVATKGAESVKLTHPIRYLEKTLAAVPAAAAAAKPESLATSRADSISALRLRIDSLRTQLTREEPIGWVSIGTPNAASDTDRTIIGRPIAGGTYKWFFTPGSVVPLVARENGSARVRLDRDLDVYVDNGDARDVAADQAPARRVASNIKVRPSAMGEDVIIPIGPRAPYFVEETDRAIVLTLYGVRGNTDIVNYGAGDSLVRAIDWAQETNGRARITVALRHAPYGYLVLWENNSLVLKLRGRPAVDAGHPLSGLVIAVDPGHPPIGATGPTGLWEPRATLPIAFQLKRILEERGARVVMTRTTDSAVALEARPVIARKANVNAFVSIHLNAYGDGTNPFLSPGTGTYFFRTHSEPLARAVQRGMVHELGLADLGINYDNLAVVRGTWYPAILCEGAFIIMPDQEAALRTPEYQERYARGVADGLENYFRQLPLR